MSGRYAPETIEGGFAVEVADAPLLHDGLNLADLAHALLLLDDGIAPRDAARRLLDVLVEAVHTPATEFGYDPAHGETYSCRERRFAQQIGRDAGWLHAGRPRREAVRIALRLRLRRDVVALVEAAAGFVGAVAEQAARHSETYLADQTYLQHAQPSTFGHYLLSFASPALRDIDRLLDELDRLNRSPAGAGGVNGSAVTTDREAAARTLGFDGAIEHIRDAMWQTDGFVGLVATAAGLVTSLSALAEDLEIWSSEEFGYVLLADGHTRSSVLMPQKRNPYALTMVRGEAGVLIGRLTGLLAATRTPSARSDGLIVAYGEVPRALDLARRATALMAGVVGGLTVRSGRMAEVLRSGHTQAADLAEYVMRTGGLDYRSAYDVVGACVRRAAEAGLGGVDITGAMLDEQALRITGDTIGMTGRDLSEVLDPQAIVRSRVVPGGAAPETVRGMAERMSAAAGEAAAAAAGRRAGFDAAETALLQRATAIAGGRSRPADGSDEGELPWTSPTSTSISGSGSS